MYIDIHTHRETGAVGGGISVMNFRLRSPLPVIPESDLFMIGLHPWDSPEPAPDFQFLRDTASRPNCIGIGECGLDRLRGAEISSQLRLLEYQVEIAETLHKPVIIHCVRAWLEILQVQRASGSTVPWIIHGFRGKRSTADQLIERDFYLSFGDSILTGNSVLTGILRDTPDNRLFLETDDGSRTIEEIYQAASSIKNIPLGKLQEILIANFNGIRGNNKPS